LLLCCDISCAVNLFLQEDAVRKKYGGKLPKKAPLISKVTSLSFATSFKVPFLAWLYHLSMCFCLKRSFETDFCSWIISLFGRIMNVLILILPIGLWERYFLVLEASGYHYAIKLFNLTSICFIWMPDIFYLCMIWL
jgi:hypothetical protein